MALSNCFFRCIHNTLLIWLWCLIIISVLLDWLIGKRIVSFAGRYFVFSFSHVNYVHIRVSHFLTDMFVSFFCCQRFVTIKDAVLHQLHDEDLTVIQAALSLEGLTEIISPLDILEAFRDVLNRCLSFLKSGQYEVFWNLHCHHSCF